MILLDIYMGLGYGESLHSIDFYELSKLLSISHSVSQILLCEKSGSSLLTTQ